MNVSVGEMEDRPMMTGLHTVADIFCVGCGSIVGWKYVRLWGSASFKHHGFFACVYVVFSYSSGAFQETAYEKNQKYKEGKSVLERSVEMLCIENDNNVIKVKSCWVLSIM